MKNPPDQAYFVKHMFASLKAAEMAADGFVKLVHLDFAGRYTIAATRLLAAGQPEICRGSNISASSFVMGRRRPIISR